MHALVHRRHCLSRSAPDAQTLWLTSVGAVAINPSLYEKLMYDPAQGRGAHRRRACRSRRRLLRRHSGRSAFHHQPQAQADRHRRRAAASVAAGDQDLPGDGPGGRGFGQLVRAVRGQVDAGSRGRRDEPGREPGARQGPLSASVHAFTMWWRRIQRPAGWRKISRWYDTEHMPGLAAVPGCARDALSQPRRRAAVTGLPRPGARRRAGLPALARRACHGLERHRAPAFHEHQAHHVPGGCKR
jgi:hypothetical protein